MRYNAIISHVAPDSPAARLGLKAGDRLVAVNGVVPRDIIDLSFALADSAVELQVQSKDGGRRNLKVEKDPDADLGLEFASAVFDGIKRCANKCLFCFVDQMPPGLRESLYIKDDDFRLSFLYGNFITLTNLSQADLDRIRKFHLSPLYVSVHTTDGRLRQTLLGTKRACRIMDDLKALIACGVQIHAQVVLCPGINDGEALSRTVFDLWSMYPDVASVAVVPVGLTRYREGRQHLRPVNAALAQDIVDRVAEWQERFRSETGCSFVYLADEFYLQAGRRIPAAFRYDGFPQLENGVGIVRQFIDSWRKCPAVLPPDAQEGRIDVVSGTAAASVLRTLVADLGGKAVVVPIVNRFFGPSVTVSGLLTGQDIITALSAGGPRRGVVVPAAALRQGEDVFLDGVTLQDVARRLGVPVRAARTGEELKRILCSWNEPAAGSGGGTW